MDFETAYAWNRLLARHPDAASISVNTLDGFFPTRTGTGFLASSRMSVSAGDAESTAEQREYVASYFVSPGVTYCGETPSAAADPRDGGELVQCGPGRARD